MVVEVSFPCSGGEESALPQQDQTMIAKETVKVASHSSCFCGKLCDFSF